MKSKTKVVMLCGRGQSSRIMFNGIAPHVNIMCVIIEDKASRKRMVIRRIKKLGLKKVIGQILFVLANRILKRASRSRFKELMLNYDLSNSQPPENITEFVDSVNSDKTIALLKKYNPEAVVVNGTRIISKKVLSSIDAPFINTHMGITPKYRGAHGGYWALAMEDIANCGVTVHLVDQGIDTGGILYQGIIQPDRADNFNTYPVHQIAKAIPLMKAALDDIKERRIDVKEGVLPSQLWHHPTILEYIRHWIQIGVK